MKYCILTSGLSSKTSMFSDTAHHVSSAMHLQYFAQSNGYKFSDIVVIDQETERYDVLKAYAILNDFNVHFVNDIYDRKNVDYLKQIEPDIIVIITNHIIRKDLLNIPKLGLINVHGGLLPEYRGRGSDLWALLEGNEPGITAHYVDTGIDTGNILVRKEVKINQGESIAAYRSRRYYMYRWQVLLEALKKAEKGDKGIRQEIEDGKQYFTMHPKLSKIVKMKIEKASMKE